MPAQWLSAFTLRIVIFCLRLQHDDAVFGSPQHGPSVESVRCIEKGERADGACLRASVRNSDDRPALFHCLWSMGTPRYGHVDFYKVYFRRRTNSTVQ